MRVRLLRTRSSIVSDYESHLSLWRGTQTMRTKYLMYMCAQNACHICHICHEKKFFTCARTHIGAFFVRWGFPETLKKNFLLEHQWVMRIIVHFVFSLSYLCSVKADIRQHPGFVYKSLNETKKQGERKLTEDWRLAKWEMRNDISVDELTSWRVVSRRVDKLILSVNGKQ